MGPDVMVRFVSIVITSISGKDAIVKHAISGVLHIKTSVIFVTDDHQNVHHAIIHMIQTSDHYAKHVMSRVSLSVKRKVVKNAHGKRIVDRVKMCTKTIAHINPLLEEIVAPLHAKT